MSKGHRTQLEGHPSGQTRENLREKNVIVHCNQLRIYEFMHLACVCSQSYPTLRNPMDCGQSGFLVHGIFQARILEWVAIFSSKESSQHRNRTRVSGISSMAGGFFTIEYL